jgi:hypothetical protein
MRTHSSGSDLGSDVGLRVTAQMIISRARSGQLGVFVGLTRTGLPVPIQPSLTRSPGSLFDYRSNNMFSTKDILRT